MENTRTTQENTCKLIKAKPETVDFLLAFSKSLHITNTDGLQFERNLN